MLPPVGWPGWSNPSGTMTWTRTMPWPSNPSPLSLRNTCKRRARIDPGRPETVSTNAVADGAGTGGGDRLPRGRVRGPAEFHAGRRDPEAGRPGPDRARRLSARPVLRGGRPGPDDHGG